MASRSTSRRSPSPLPLSDLASLSLFPSQVYFTALTYGVPTVGVELLSSLVSLSTAVQQAQGAPSMLTSFTCADALHVDLPLSTRLVYVDDTAWDRPVVAQVAQRLAHSARAGTLVVHNTATSRLPITRRP